VKKALLSLALALVGANAAYAINGVTAPVHEYGPFYISEAYPALVQPLTERIPCLNADFEDNNCFNGSDFEGPANVTSVPGVLCLQSTGTDARRLDTRAFNFCPPRTDLHSPYVQNYRLTKVVPRSDKCPFTYQGSTFTQFGGDVRTWWTLIYTSPRTRFILELDIICYTPLGQPRAHRNRFIFEVRATLESLLQVINVLHTNTIGLSEIPCIASEDMYACLVDAVEELQGLVDPATGKVEEENRYEAQDVLFNLEALIVSFTAFTDCWIESEVFSQRFPPSNDVQQGNAGWTGIIDTIENPCGCKLLVDVEEIGKCYNISSN